MKSEHEIIDRLKSIPPAVVSHDLAPEILAKVRADGMVSSPRTILYRVAIPLAAAASVALLIGGMWMAGHRSVPPGRQAMAWLCQTQESDGSWSAAKWGGNKHFEVALTGLSLLTLLEDRAEAGSAVDKAIGYLLQHQQPDGRFGDLFSSAPYNHGIATLALAKAYETRKDEAIRAALDKAVAVICSSQYAEGGWGYYQEARKASNLSITLWQIEALRLASKQGWPEVQSRVERGLRWMAGVAADDGSFGYERQGDAPGGASQTLTAMGAMSLLDPAYIGLVSPGRRQAIKDQMQRMASTPSPDMDFYRRYFLAAALRKMDEESAYQGLAAMRRELENQQIKQGSEAGSWTADNRWGSSGGRIYATALASLALR